MATPLGKQIRARRVSLGIKRRELADRIGKSYEHIANIENGHSEAAPETLVLIARELGVNIEMVMSTDRPGAA
jgi:transcriptional regulator with XRE-family HTH domain